MSANFTYTIFTGRLVGFVNDYLVTLIIRCLEEGGIRYSYTHYGNILYASSKFYRKRIEYRRTNNER